MEYNFCAIFIIKLDIRKFNVNRVDYYMSYRKVSGSTFVHNDGEIKFDVRVNPVALWTVSSRAPSEPAISDGQVERPTDDTRSGKGSIFGLNYQDFILLL